MRSVIYTLLCLFCLLPANMIAQNDGEKVVTFFSDNATMEDDPKQQKYNITIFSPDGEWKMQLNYKSESMFGTFTNNDFNLSGNGKNYNYARNPKNDMVFYSFTDMNVSVADEGTCYRVKANCLTNNKTRFIVEATIDAPQPKETRTDDLGYARLQPNSFYGTWAVYAENDNYKLAYGVVGNEILGTFYRADMLLPELYDKKADKNINVLTATALHTQQGDSTIMKVDILGDDLVLYSLTMYNGPYDIDITSEETIDIHGVVMQDLSAMYGCYQLGGANDNYGIAVAIKPEALSAGKTTWTNDDCVMQYTKLVTMPDATPLDIFDINATLVQGEKYVIVKADLKCMNHVLYHVNMHLDQGVMPEATDTVNIDYGHVGMIDYTKGMGIVGLGAFETGKSQMRLYLYTHELEGEYETEDFDMDMCDIGLVNGDTFVFHDAKYMKATMDKVDGKVMITVDMYCVDNVLYHATMYIDDMKCLKDGEYSVNINDDVLMVSVQEGYDDNYGEYLLQFQDLDKVYDEYDRIVGDGSVFSFYFGHEGPGVAGTYGYSDGTLAEDVYHTFFENHCEVRMAPVAGTLSLKPTEKYLAQLTLGNVNTYIYNVEFQFVGQNGAIYKGKGANVLVCIDEDGNLVDIDEPGTTDIINQHLNKEGYRVRKVLKGGKIIIEKDGKEYDVNGVAGH